MRPVPEPLPRPASDVATPWLPAVLAALGACWAAQALLDPDRPLGSVAGPLVATAALVLGRALGAPLKATMLAASFALAYGIGGLSRPEMLRADFGGYYAYLRSAAFDHDLDFANEWQAWDYPAQPVTATGHRFNQFTVGPALLWSPFFLLAHSYVRVENALLGGRYEADGYSTPYLRSAALGTITAAVLGAWLLGSVVAVRAGPGVALLAVAGAMATSPVLYYMFVQPGMAHGAMFALAAALLWTADRVRAAPSLWRWLLLGALLGAAILMRLQAIVLAVVPAALAVEQLLRRRARPHWVAAAAGIAVLALVPQFLAWKMLFGTFLRAPPGPGLREWGSGRGWFDPSSPRFLDVLLAADHGLFTWTPAMLLAVAGLVLALRRWTALAVLGLVVLLATAWLNGSRADWWGDDAFGARRFDLFVPFAAVGYAALLEACVRMPLLAPGAVLALLALWNVGVVSQRRSGGLKQTAVLEQVVARQARQLRRLAEDALGRIGGHRGRALAYKAFVGDFFYLNLDLRGAIDLARSDARYLAGGWSGPENREGPPTFRWAAYPRACVRLPVDRPERDLLTVVTARAPGRLQAQTMTVTLNERVLKHEALTREWADVSVLLPLDLLVSGENLLCLRFSASLPEQEGFRAAAVSRIRLPE